ncbi:MAG: DUF2341 domain-containing protein [Gammaproteobacteria bacterium]|nr:DUF2341 domain-containing protein [Gammaproteobacteria bacterium]MBU1482919.1 DUF2341 domain-containing protein [Gammaproteobacteria bacterium]
MKTLSARHIKSFSIFCIAALALLPGLSHAWWNGDWDTRKKITLNTAQEVSQDALTQVPVLVRLHTGNFDFGNVKENGGDLRFVAEDDKTPLKYHIEKFDMVNEMALVWVQVPILATGKSGEIYMYSGNFEATPADDAKATYDASQIAVFHFDGVEPMPQDRSGNGNHASQFTAKMDDGSLIGRGATFDGGSTITIPASPTLKLAAAQGYTVSAWIRTAVVQNNAVLFKQQDGEKSISLSIVGGKLVAAAGATETPKTADVVPGLWHHVALTAGQVLTVYLDGKEIAQVPVTLADMQGEVTLGGGFTGEMDELKLAGIARSADWIKVAADGQGSDALLLGYGQDEMNDGGGGTSYFGTILHSVTLDGWVVIGILFVMAIISWVVMALKAVVIDKVRKGNKAFLHDYGNLSVAETAKLDHDESEEEAEIENSQLLIALYGKHDHYQDSTLYRIYHTGIQEIKNRFGKAEASEQFLSPQAIGAIKASLDATLVRENQKLSSLMVLLTIAISGGPFLGLLGTVVGVMITFAAIAATGDVNVAAIAPGIAAALVATVAGLAVAIPALFGYNYLGSVIKNTSADMHIFVDEYISRITEAYSR